MADRHLRFEMISALLDAKLSEAQKRRIIRERTTRAVQSTKSSILNDIQNTS
jgi:hypothetical protein